MDNLIKATIDERGNGFPSAGAYVPGDDGNLYQVAKIVGRIHTGPPGSSNYVHAKLKEADWDDVDSDEDVFPAQAVVYSEC